MNAPRKIALLGTGATLRHAPFNDRSITWWMPSQLYGQVPKCDRVFEIHTERCARAAGLWYRLATMPCPVVLLAAHPEIPTSESYPIERVASELQPPVRPRPFFSDTPAWMLAYALLLESVPEEIFLYGCDLAHGSEYEHQLRSVEYFVGVAHGRGVRVMFPAASQLLKQPYVYGLDEDLRAEAVGDLRERVAQFRLQRDRAAANEDAERAVRLKFEALVAENERALKIAGAGE